MTDLYNRWHTNLKQPNDPSTIEKFLNGAEQKKRLLESLSSSDKSKLSPRFHDMAKEDKFLTPSQLVECVKLELSKKHPQLVQYLYTHELEAIDFAEYVLEKVNLPPAAQREPKHKQKEKYSKEAMSKKEPTPKQLEFLVALGFEGQVRTRLEASDAITKLKGEQK